jgi:hypothetical protein
MADAADAADPAAVGPDGAGSAGAQDGGPGVLMAMGPGFCAELVLLHWPGADR